MVALKFETWACDFVGFFSLIPLSVPCIQKHKGALADVAQLIECHPVHQNVAGLIPGQGFELHPW